MPAISHEGRRPGLPPGWVEGRASGWEELPPRWTGLPLASRHFRALPTSTPPGLGVAQRPRPAGGRGHGAGGGAEGARRAGGRPRGGSGFEVQSLTLKERVLRGLPGGLCSPRRSPAPGPGRDPLPSRVRGLGSLGVSGWSEGLGRLRGPRGVWDL